MNSINSQENIYTKIFYCIVPLKKKERETTSPQGQDYNPTLSQMVHFLSEGGPQSGILHPIHQEVPLDWTVRSSCYFNGELHLSGFSREIEPIGGREIEIQRDLL